MLNVKNLTFGFRHRRLSEDLNFVLRPQELIHFVGPNGAGKSTCLAIIAGLLHAEQGRIEYVGEEGENPVEDRRVYLEYLPAEANGLFLKMDAIENLQFWADLRGLSLKDQDLFKALARWKLDHPLLCRGFAVEKYSTGMKRRLALARLELSNAPVWLLDEPIYGLDAAACETFTFLLKEHLANGGSGLIVSHELKPIEGLVTHRILFGEKL